jgi:hypothetical protein
MAGNIGAGEGNRTLVISLEVTWALSDFNARSDNWALIGHFERKRLFAAVRTAHPTRDLIRLVRSRINNFAADLPRLVDLPQSFPVACLLNCFIGRIVF